jgi:hypothetical protein
MDMTGGVRERKVARVCGRFDRCVVATAGVWSKEYELSHVDVR